MNSETKNPSISLSKKSKDLFEDIRKYGTSIFMRFLALLCVCPQPPLK